MAAVTRAILAGFMVGVVTLSHAAPPVHLSGPQVAKKDWNTRSLTSADIDGDGRTDLALINNDSGKIEVLLQRDPDNPRPDTRRTLTRNRWEPVLEDAPFYDDSILMGHLGYALAAGDLNSDGRTDFVFTGNTTPLTIRYQGEEGSWEESWTFDNFDPEQWVSTLAIEDIDNDGRNDLAVLGKTELLLFIQNEHGRMAEPRRFRMAQGNAHGLHLIDLNGDGLRDIIYLSGNNQYRRFSVRMQQEEGNFGPELGFRMRTGALSLAHLEGEAVPAFATIEGKTRLVETFYFKPGTEAPTTLEDLQVRDYVLGADVRQAGLYTTGDYNNDGRTDVVVADASGARVILFLQTRGGDFSEGVPYPSFSNISSISTLRGSEGDRLAVASVREGIAGIARYVDGRLQFPEILTLTGEPKALTTGDFNGDGSDDIVVVEQRERAFFLTVIAEGKDGWVPSEGQPLTDVKRDPEALLSLRLNQDNRADLIVFAPREPARLFVVDDEGLFQEQATHSALRRTSLNGVELGRIGVVDIDEDGQDELLVGDTGFVRALRLSSTGDLEIVDQYNTRSPQAVVKGPVLADIDQDGTRELIIYDDNADRLELLKETEDGVLRSHEINDIGSIDILRALPLVGDKQHGNTLLLLGQQRFWAVPLDRPGWQKVSLRSAYETDLDEVQYTDVAAGDLNGDGVPELIVIDGRQNLLEVLTYDDAEGYTSTLHFIVFDANMHGGGGRGGSQEPRELIVEDFTGDGLKDIALLVHNRVLLYSQVAAP